MDDLRMCGSHHDGWRRRPKTHFAYTRLCKGFDQEGECWSYASDDLASTITDLNSIEMVWDELDSRVK
jgi:hypothetical protein